MSQERPRVLVVDDEPGLLEVYADVLGEGGYEVTTATNGRTAIQALSASPFDAVLSDIVMPDLDGLQLLKAVRELDLDVAVVLVTANPRLETAVKAIEYGALQYLIKPVPGPDLCRAVARAVAWHHAAMAKRAFLEHVGGDARFIGDRAALEPRFERAVSRLWLAYQPIVRAGDGVLFAHEALARTGESSFPNADALLDAAERLGRVQDLGRAVRRQAASADSQTLFVNVHASELGDAELYDPRSALACRARHVVLEITERAALEAVSDVPSRIARLRELGYRIAVDDLGAGYSGLSSLSALAPEVVKLDMSLIRGCDQEPVKRKLIATVASLCRDLGTPVVAEGVETEAERAAVTEEGCELLQGFLLGAPGARPSLS